MTSSILQSSNPKNFASYMLISVGSCYQIALTGGLFRRSRFLIRIFKRYMAFFACSVTCFLAFRNEPDLEKTVPRYL